MIINKHALALITILFLFLHFAQICHIKMIVSLIIVRYPKYFVPLALLSMAVLRLPLWLNRKISFWKLLGCGKNGTFDKNPDWQQWGLLCCWEQQQDFEKFYSNGFVYLWWKLFASEKWLLLLQPVEAHGFWDKKQPFKPAINKQYEGKVGVLTRATININKLSRFWENVPGVANIMSAAPGFVTSVGVGEAPLFMQATFSVWDDLESVKNFAYKSKEHAEVIKLTRNEKWYKEELFARFTILESRGTLNGKNPLVK